jgi:hypothetical protein
VDSLHVTIFNCFQQETPQPPSVMPQATSG